MEDTQIIELLTQRDPQGLTALTETYAGLCRGLARRILPDVRDAEECLNDAWMQAWEAIPIAQPAHLSVWLCHIVRNLALNRLTHDRVQVRDERMELYRSELSECLPAAGDAEASADDIVAQSVTGFLARQEQRQRALFIRRYFYMESVAELAAYFDMKSATVSDMLSRLRQALKLHLEQEGTWTQAEQLTQLLDRLPDAMLQQALEEQEAVAPLPRFPWKRIIALAICAAVALGIGFGLEHWRNRADPPTVTESSSPNR